VLRLPSSKTEPLPSPQLEGIVEYDEEDAEEFAEWKVEGIVLPADCAAEVLKDSARLEDMLNAVRGRDLLLFVYARDFALRLLANKRFLPSVQDKNGKITSIWLPLIDREEERLELSVIEGAMPQACTSAQPDKIGSELLRGFIRNFIDLMCRKLAADSKKVDANEGYEDSVRWALALGDRNPALSCNSESLVCKAIWEWSSRILKSSEGEFRLCFRIDDVGEVLRLSTLAQSRKDPSLVADLSDSKLISAGRFGGETEGMMLHMGFASRLSPLVERILHMQRPGGLVLSPSEAYDFLDRHAPLLAQNGFGVMVPDWWKERRKLLGMKVIARPANVPKPSGGMFGIDALLDYDLEIMSGGRELEKEEIERLLSLDVPLARLDGR
jgi:hypothetical protein